MLTLKQLFVTSWVVHYLTQQVELLNGVYKSDSTFQNSSENQLLTVLLFGSGNFVKRQ